MKPIAYIPPHGVPHKTFRAKRRAAQLGGLLGLIALMFAAGYVLHVMGGLEATAGLR